MASKDGTTAENKAVDMEELVEVELQLTRDKQEDKYVGLNGRNFLIRRGEKVMIPRWAKEILDNAEEMEMKALKNMKNLPNR